MSNSFYHAGDIGDLLYGLAVIPKLGGGHLFVGERCAGKLQPRVGITKEVFETIRHFVVRQPMVYSVEYTAFVPFVKYDLNKFRDVLSGKIQCKPPPGYASPTLLQCHFEAFNLKPSFSPWLHADYIKLVDVVFCRSARWRSSNFNWEDAVAKYGKSAAFIGLHDEYKDFVSRFGYVKYIHTPTFVEAAGIINAAKLVISNSTSLLALALGLGKMTIQEYPDNQEVHTNGPFPTLLLCSSGKVSFPDI